MHPFIHWTCGRLARLRSWREVVRGAGAWARYGLAAIAALTASHAAAEYNPCDFSGGDEACKVQGGEYRVLKPAGEGPFPVAVYLHGSLGEADIVYNSGRMRQAIVNRGYVLLVPRALDVVNYTVGRGTGWSLRAREDHPRDDIGFLRNVLDHVEREYRIDRRRVILLGQSDGGFLIWEIACHEPGFAAAYASHAGSYGGPLPSRCGSPARFLQTHGRRDTTVPFENIRMSPDGRRLSSANPLEGLDLLARANGCEPRGEVPVTQYQSFDRTQWRECGNKAALEYWVHGGGHGYPGHWISAVLDWFETFDLEPPKPGQRVVRKVGQPSEAKAGRFKSVSGTTRFKSVPQN
ncbi:MAG: hypothetical protein AAGG47_08305 [Pseudomonadota bacterium]